MMCCTECQWYADHKEVPMSEAMKVSGAGISVIVYSKQSAVEWCKEIIDKGGWPVVEPYREAA